jgi:hypothetical protein
MNILALIVILLTGTEAYALDANTVDNIQSMEDKLHEHIEDGHLAIEEITPLTVVDVSTTNADAATLTNAILRSLGTAINGPILMCETCRATYRQGETESVYETGMVSTDEVKRNYQNQKTKPKAAAWIRETRNSLSLRIVSLETSKVLFADTVTTGIDWSSRSIQSFSRSREAERAARGDVILHGQFDFSPIGSGAHLGYSLMQQWGDSNQYLSGLSINLSDPVLGLGLNTFKVFPELNNTLIGGKFLVSIPSALSSALSKNSDSPLDQSPYTLVAMIKYPLFRGEPAKYFINAYISTNANFGVGISW